MKTIIKNHISKESAKKDCKNINQNIKKGLLLGYKKAKVKKGKSIISSLGLIDTWQIIIRGSKK